MATYDYNLDEDRFSGYLSQIQLPGIAKPYLIKDYEARSAANKAQEELDTLAEKVENLGPSSSAVDFTVEEDVLIITKL